MPGFNDVEILLIEDNPQDAELAVRALRKQNLLNSLHHVKDGAEALAFIFGTGPYAGRNVENVPRLVLLDLKLPKVDGLEFLQKIKADPRTQMIPVVALTSSREDRDVRECYRLGVNGYIVKPVESDKFQEAVKQLGTYWLLTNRTPQWPEGRS
jgi:CheY-like chemotaxis protein